MATEETQASNKQDIKYYRAIEARFYGDLMKTCRRYGAELSIISVLGIMDIAKSELKELDKQNRQLMKQKRPEPGTKGIDVIA